MVDGGRSGSTALSCPSGALIFLCSLPEGVREGRARVERVQRGGPNARRANAVAPPRVGSPLVCVTARRCCAQRPRKRAYGLRWATVTRANGSGWIARAGSFGARVAPQPLRWSVTLRWPQLHVARRSCCRHIVKKLLLLASRPPKAPLISSRLGLWAVLRSRTRFRTMGITRRFDTCKEPRSRGRIIRARAAGCSGGWASR
jgi:hypothetical protein